MGIRRYGGGSSHLPRTWVTPLRPLPSTCATDQREEAVARLEVLPPPSPVVLERNLGELEGEGFTLVFFKERGNRQEEEVWVQLGARGHWGLQSYAQGQPPAPWPPVPFRARLGGPEQVGELGGSSSEVTVASEREVGSRPRD